VLLFELFERRLGLHERRLELHERRLQLDALVLLLLGQQQQLPLGRLRRLFVWTTTFPASVEAQCQTFRTSLMVVMVMVVVVVVVDDVKVWMELL